ncbi:MAG: hypothetical protein EOM14_01970 [Clostridia bacterium]|nr:hypothetical protein [Clostridia bacterium]
MRQKFAKFMAGRYGADEFSRFLSVAALIILLISMVVGGIAQMLLFLLALATLIFSYVRVFSRKIGRRRSENAKYLAHRRKLADRLILRRDMWRQRKQYKFFRCPSCGAVLRVPRGKGKIRIVCKKCGTAFEKKT